MSQANLYEVASTINWRVYPPGHPLWSDVNFSPEHLHELLSKEAPLPTQAQLQTSWHPLLHQQPVYQQQQLFRATPPKSGEGLAFRLFIYPVLAPLRSESAFD